MNVDPTPGTSTGGAGEAGPPNKGFSLRKRFLSLPTLSSFVIAGAFIFFLSRRFDVDLAATWGYVRNSNPLWFLLAFLLYYLSFPVRALRWRALLENCGAFEAKESTRPSVPYLSESILQSWFANSILWFRLGDAYRAYLVSDRNRISFSMSMGTVAAERLLDLVAVCGLLLVAGLGLFLTDSGVRETRIVIVTSVALASIGLTGLLMMRLLGPRVERFLPKPIQMIYNRFLAGTLGSFRRLPLLAALSVLVWLLEAARLYFVVTALGLEMSVFLILLAALAHSLLTTIPLTPGGLGFAELGLSALLALSPNLTHEQAVAATFLDRSITYLSIVTLGGLDFALRQFFGHREPPSRVATEQKSPSP